MARKSTKKEGKPRVMLQGRILFRDQFGEINDAIHDHIHGLQKFADTGAQAICHLNRIEKRLDLLFAAAEHRSQVDASLVRLAVDDIRSEMEKNHDLKWYLRVTQEMFEHSEALPPLPTPDTRNTGGSLTLIKPA